MINDILHSVEEAEKEAELIIEEAKKEANRIKATAREEVVSEQKSNTASFNEKANEKRDAVSKEEAENNRKAEESVEAEVSQIEKSAREKESDIVNALAKRLLA